MMETLKVASDAIIRHLAELLLRGVEVNVQSRHLNARHSDGLNDVKPCFLAS